MGQNYDIICEGGGMNTGLTGSDSRCLDRNRGVSDSSTHRAEEDGRFSEEERPRKISILPLEELSLAMKSVKTIYDDIGIVTADVKELSGSLSRIGKTVGAVNALIGNVGASTAVKAVSMKTGIRAGLEYLFTHILRKGERQ